MPDQKAIQKYREEQIKVQNGLDPLLLEPLVRPSLDHNHFFNGETRGVLSAATNMVEGRIVATWMKYLQHHTDRSLSFFLRNLADYLEVDYSTNPLHPSFVADMRKFLERCTKETIISRAKSDLGLEILSKDALGKEKLKETLIMEYLNVFIQQCEEGKWQ